MTTTDGSYTTPGGPSVPPAEPPETETFGDSPAFPTTLANPGDEAIMGHNGQMIPSRQWKQYSGITVRQYLAAAAMEKVSFPTTGTKAAKIKQYVDDCLVIADELISRDAEVAP